MPEFSSFSGHKDVFLHFFDEVFNASHDYILVTLCFDCLLKTLLTFLLSACLCLELDAQAVILFIRVQEQHVCDTSRHTFCFHYCCFDASATSAVRYCKHQHCQVGELKPEPLEARLLYLTFYVFHCHADLER